MSNSVNTSLLERASDMITYFEGKQPALVLERDLSREDLDALYQHVCEAEAIASQQEFEAIDV